MTTFFVGGHKLHHPVHGTFFVDRLFETSTWEVTRVHMPVGATQNVVERLAPWGEMRTLAQAKRIVRQRIAELDAQIEAERCDQCGATLVHVAGDEVRALLCSDCNRDSSALNDEDDLESHFTNARIVDNAGCDV